MTRSVAGGLRQRVARDGTLSFRDFMEAALYDPEEGYYSRGASIGDGGDFVTSPSISPLFARSLARAFVRDAERFAGTLDFLEAAASSGEFLRDFRQALFEIAPEISTRTRLWAVERSERGRQRIASKNVAERICRSVEEIAPDSLSGWIFSNELFDALPVHRVVRSEGRLFELCVTLSAKEDAFEWTGRPAPRELGDYLASFGIDLAEGQVAEVNLEAGPLYRRLCATLTKGRIVTFDYGHRAGVLYHSEARPRGTLAVHSKGRRGGDPLESPGEVDLTAHVNWDDLIREGESAGLSTERILRQAQFLLRAGLFEDAKERKLEALRLFDPEGLGDDLSVLIQSKSMPPIRFPAELTTAG